MVLPFSVGHIRPEMKLIHRQLSIKIWREVWNKDKYWGRGDIPKCALYSEFLPTD